MADPRTWTSVDVERAFDREGVIFAAVDGRKMMVTHDEECTGLYAWPDGEECAAHVSFGSDEEAAYVEIAGWLNAAGVRHV